MGEEEFEECINAMMRGDKQGLRQVYEVYARYIYTIVYGILGSRENAEDVTSEFFIRLWEKAGQYKGGNGHKGYLAAIARNMAVDHLRKYKREELTAAVHGMETDADGDARAAMGGRRKRAEDASVSAEEEAVGTISLKEILGHLKPEERQIVDMKVLGGMTFKEIAGLLSLPMGTVTWRYQNAVKKLRRCGYEGI